MTPERDAVRFVYRDKRNIPVRKPAAHLRRKKFFRAHVKKLHRPVDDVLQNQRGLVRGLGAVEHRRGDSVCLERFHLIPLQGHERRDNEREPVKTECGNLKTDRLAPARGHEYECVFP